VCGPRGAGFEQFAFVFELLEALFQLGLDALDGLLGPLLGGDEVLGRER